MKLLKKVFTALAVVCLAATSFLSVSAEGEETVASNDANKVITLQNANVGSTYYFYRLLDIDTTSTKTDANIYKYNEAYKSVLLDLYEDAHKTTNSDTSNSDGSADDNAQIETQSSEPLVSDMVNWLQGVLNSESEKVANNTTNKWDPSTSVMYSMYNTLKTTENVKATYSATVTTTTTASKVNLVYNGAEAGYYLIAEESASGSLNSRSLVIGVTKAPTSTLTITAKSDDTPTVDFKVRKTVLSSQESLASTSSWETTNLVSATDYSYGDKIPYQLSIELPSGLYYFSDYDLVAEVVLPKGLNFSGSDVAYLYNGGTDGGLISDSTLFELGITTNADGSTTLKFTCKKTASLVKQYSKENNNNLFFDIRFLATFDMNNAIIGKATIDSSTGKATVSDSTKYGNIATASIQYSTDAYDAMSENPTMATIEATPVSVYTFQLIVDKVDKEDLPVDGADFTLYRSNTSGTNSTEVALSSNNSYNVIKTISELSKTVQNTEDKDTSDPEVDSDKEQENNEISPVDAEESEETDPSETGTTYKGQSRFTWTGIASGTYSLKESTVPKGYYGVGETVFKIEPTYSGYTLSALVIKDSAGATNEAFAVDDNSFIISTKIVNNKGFSLVATGGVGTTFLMVGGAILLGGALIAIVAKKRMQLQ
jgi:hypothetical protein